MIWLKLSTAIINNRNTVYEVLGGIFCYLKRDSSKRISRTYSSKRIVVCGNLEDQEREKWEGLVDKNYVESEEQVRLRKYGVRDREKNFRFRNLAGK